MDQLPNTVVEQIFTFSQQRPIHLISLKLVQAGHGKGAPDGIGAVVKRAADTLVNTYSRDITCSADLIEGNKL